MFELQELVEPGYVTIDDLAERCLHWWYYDEWKRIHKNHQELFAPDPSSLAGEDLTLYEHWYVNCYLADVAETWQWLGRIDFDFNTPKWPKWYQLTLKYTLWSYARSVRNDPELQRDNDTLTLLLSRLRNSLAQGKLSAFVLTEDGTYVRLDPSFWRSVHAPDGFEPGSGSELHTTQGTVTGSVQFLAQDVQRYLSGEADPHVSVVIGAVEHGPFLSFMCRAERELGLAGQQRIPKKQITEWLRSNWPAELGDSSDRIIENMATLLRNPKERTGGFYRGQSAPSDTQNKDKKA